MSRQPILRLAIDPKRMDRRDKDAHHSKDGNLNNVSRPNGVSSSYGYDLAGRLTNINHQGSAGSLLNFDYTLDANGNRTAVNSNAGNESYTLDELSRLTQVLYGNGESASLSYDANGNRL